MRPWCWKVSRNLLCLGIRYFGANMLLPSGRSAQPPIIQGSPVHVCAKVHAYQSCCPGKMEKTIDPRHKDTVVCVPMCIWESISSVEEIVIEV